MEIPRENFAFSGKPFFLGGLCTRGVGLYFPSEARVVIKTPRVKRPLEKKGVSDEAKFSRGIFIFDDGVYFLSFEPYFVAFEGFNLLAFGLDATARRAPKAGRRPGGPGGGAPWGIQERTIFQ